MKRKIVVTVLPYTSLRMLNAGKSGTGSSGKSGGGNSGKSGRSGAGGGGKSR